MAEDFKKIKKVIDKFQNITLLPSSELQSDSFPASLALSYSLKKLGKNVNLIYKHLPEKFNFLIKKDEFQTLDADFLISIKESGLKLSQIFYEKIEDNLNLYLKTNGDKLKKENIILKPLNSKPLLITIGIESLDKIKDILKKEKFESIINLDSSLILSNFYRLKTGNSFRLFRRALNKLKFSNEENTGWVTLKENDFKETKSFPSELPFTLEKLTSSIFPFQNFLCLWENKSSPISVQGVFYSPNKKILEKILENFTGEQKGNGILFQAEEIDIQKVKDDIIDLCKKLPVR